MKNIYLLLLIMLPLFSFGQFAESFREMSENKEADYETYEQLILDASNYIFSTPVDRSSVEFISATQIVGYWMNKETPLRIPTFGNFFDSLTNEEHQQFLYTIAMINYMLDQKINHGRTLKNEKERRQKFSEQEDVREVQLEGAKIFLAYAGKKENNVPLPQGSEKYLEAYENGELEKVFFE